MFTDPMMNSKQKNAAFKALKKVPETSLHPVLISAAFENHIFPTPVETEQLTAIKTAYKACSNLPSVRLLIEQSILEYFKSCGYEHFRNLLDTAFTDDNWGSGFLIYLINTLNINIETNPLVVLTIQDGKVYWKYVCGEKILHDRTARNDPSKAFNFDDKKTITMTWEQFREFKDAGKRGGTVAVTKDRFALNFSRSERTVADEIWDELKQKGILDKNNRLSHAWRCATGKVPLTYIERRVTTNRASPANKIQTANYTKTINALNAISNNPQYAETIARTHSVTLFRPNRSPKNWDSTGRVTIHDGKSEDYKVKPWDVSTYSDLHGHAKPFDNLDHDHLPSTAYLKKVQSNLAAQGFTSNETKDNWGCIAISETLHENGISYSKSCTGQAKRIEKPFFDEVSDYLDKLEMNWQHTLLIDNEYLKALGAFRYLYRCNTTGKSGSTPSYFFYTNPALRGEVDQLFMDRLERFMTKKEATLVATARL